MKNNELYAKPFSDFYPIYVNKANRKGRSKEEVDEIIFWLFGYDDVGLRQQIDQNKSWQMFFDEAPCINENTDMIKGKVCGVSVQDVEEDIMRHIRFLDKLIDELAKGKPMEKILRERK